MKWIKVSDKLPEEHEIVLVTDGKDIEKGQIINLYNIDDIQSKWFVCDEFADFRGAHVTHWMDLPSLPKD
jgi:hypothetical protein